MAVITISRQFGAGGWTLGSRLAKVLGYRYVHEDMIKEVAAKINVSSDRIRALESRGASRLDKFLDKLVNTSYVERLISDKYGFVDEQTYVDVVREIIHELYKEGNVIIIGRGSQYVLRGYPDCWHLLMVGDLETRTRFVMNKYNLSEGEAQKVILKRDQVRLRFLSFFSEQEDHENPLLYDLVINMSRLSMEKAEKIVLDLVA